MKSSVGDGKRRSGLFLERLCRVGELNTADTCQGFWGYNREAFRKKGCLLTNTDGYIWWRVCVCDDYLCLWMHVCIYIYRSCKKWKMHFCVFYVSSTHEGLPTILWKILGTLPCWFSFRLGWMVCYSLRPLSALCKAVEPHVMAACHTLSIVWADTLWFLALVTEWGSSTAPRELFISHGSV